MSVAKSVKNDPKVMDPVVPTEGVYVIGGAGIEQIADLVGRGHAYSGGGAYVLAGLVIGQSYKWTKGANDTSLVYGAAVIQNGLPVTPTLTASGQFIATATTATLNGTPAAGVTATVLPAGLYFQKLWLYPGKAVVAGAITANGANVTVGKSGLAAVPYLSDTLAPTDGPLQISLPLGQKLALDQIILKGAIGDGVFYSFT